jgi:hypothetical protein
MLGSAQKILHEAVTLDPETERRAIAQPHDAHRGRDVRKRERDQVGDMQRRRHR